MGFKKPDLMALTTCLGMEVKHAKRKKEIKHMLIDRMVADYLLDQEFLDKKEDISDSSDSAVKLKQLEMQQEMEMAKLQLEQKRLQIEEQERKEKLELEKAFKQQELDAKIANGKRKAANGKRKA